jgi:hypothetical protein
MSGIIDEVEEYDMLYLQMKSIKLIHEWITMNGKIINE